MALFALYSIHLILAFVVCPFKKKKKRSAVPVHIDVSGSYQPVLSTPAFLASSESTKHRPDSNFNTHYHRTQVRNWQLRNQGIKIRPGSMRC